MDNPSQRLQQLQDQRNFLKQRLQELQLQIEQRIKEKDKAFADKQVISEKLQHLNSRLREADKAVKSITSRYVDRQETIMDLEQTIEGLKEEKEEWLEAKQQLENDKAKLQEEKEKTQVALNDLQKAYDRLNIDRNLLNNQVKKLKNQLTHHERTRSLSEDGELKQPGLTHTWSTSPNKTQIHAENEALKEKVALLQSELQKEYEKCKKYEHQLESMIRIHQEQMKLKDQALMAVQQQISESDQAHNEKEQLAQKYKQRINQLEQYSIDLEKEAKGKKQKISELTQLLSKKEQEMQRIQRENAKKLKEIEDNHKFQFNKPSKDKTMKNLQQIISGCISRGKSDEIIQEIQQKLQLESEYERIIKTLQEQLEEAKKQNFARHKLLLELMDQEKSKETADKMMKSDRQSLEQSLRKSKQHLGQIEGSYQKRINEMDLELTSSKELLRQTQLQKNELTKILANPDDIIAHYILVLKEGLKQQTPSIANQLLCNYLSEFSEKILKFLPKDKQPGRSELRK